MGQRPDAEKAHVAFGPEGSYFARSPTGKTMAYGLPPDLQSLLQWQRPGTVASKIALGSDGSWVVIWANGSAHWDLNKQYPDLEQALLLGAQKGGLAVSPQELY